MRASSWPYFYPQTTLLKLGLGNISNTQNIGDDFIHLTALWLIWQQLNLEKKLNKINRFRIFQKYMRNSLPCSMPQLPLLFTIHAERHKRASLRTVVRHDCTPLSLNLTNTSLSLTHFIPALCNITHSFWDMICTFKIPTSIISSICINPIQYDLI